MRRSILKRLACILAALALTVSTALAEDGSSHTWAGSAANPGAQDAHDAQHGDVASETVSIPVYGYIGTLHGDPITDPATGHVGEYAVDIDGAGAAGEKTDDLYILASDVIRVTVPTKMYLLYLTDLAENQKSGSFTSSALSSVGTFTNNGRNTLQVTLEESRLTPPESVSLTMKPASGFQQNAAEAQLKLLLGERGGAGGNWLPSDADVGLAQKGDTFVEQPMGTLLGGASASFAASGEANEAAFAALSGGAAQPYLYQLDDEGALSNLLTSLNQKNGYKGFDITLVFRIEISSV